MVYGLYNSSLPTIPEYTLCLNMMLIILTEKYYLGIQLIVGVRTRKNIMVSFHLSVLEELLLFNTSINDDRGVWTFEWT